jgi:hypothetical protein
MCRPSGDQGVKLLKGTSVRKSGWAAGSIERGLAIVSRSITMFLRK